MDQWLKQQPLKRKQELAPNLPRLILQTPEETPTTVMSLMTIVNSVKLLDGMTIVTYPLDLHGVEMKMNPNLSVSSAEKNVIYNSYSCISITLFI